jgi:hypothetical protein
MTIHRRTIVAHGRLTIRQLRVDLARERQIAAAVMTMEQVATRLCGGFATAIHADTLTSAIRQVLPSTPLGELEAIKTLPGMTAAAAETLHKAWHAGIDLQAAAASHPRIAAIAALEAAVLAITPPGMLRPIDLARRAARRAEHASGIFGSMFIVGITEMSPCWRPLLIEIATRIPITWKAGPRYVPDWLGDSGITIERSPPLSPRMTGITAATALHEVIEAIRWARELIATGRARPSDLAIAAASTADYDDHFLALRDDANLTIAFAHGTGVLATRDGQAAASLADVLHRGLSQTRIRRLATLTHAGIGPFSILPQGWMRLLPDDAPLTSIEDWERVIQRIEAAEWPDGHNHGPELLEALRLLAQGLTKADDIGSVFLTGQARQIWSKALAAGPPAALSATLAQLHLDDSLQAPNSIAWMPAAALAASPRPFVRLLGLTSRAWPRLVSEDRLLPSHIIPIEQLDPLPIAAADRRDFATILATTASEVTLSRPRRDAEGRLLGQSPLLHKLNVSETYLRRNRVPDHAMSEDDRLFVRPDEFAARPDAVSATACWRDWRRHDITAHDGLIRAQHPLIAHILSQDQSATSLRKLLRDPLGFVWKYGLRFKANQIRLNPLTMDGRDFGELLHQVLAGAVKLLETDGGIAHSSQARIDGAIATSLHAAAAEWQTQRATPPATIWTRTLHDIQQLAINVISPSSEVPLLAQKSYAEVPFGDTDDASNELLPWDAAQPVVIDDTGFRISGAIDRLDLSGDRQLARVSDYKSGRTPKNSATMVLDGGKELQRCLYSFAVKSLLGHQVQVDASLRYPRSGHVLHLDNPDIVLQELKTYLATARRSLEAGLAPPGPDAETSYNDLLFALPANALKSYCVRKRSAVTQALGAAAHIWEVP